MGQSVVEAGGVPTGPGETVPAAFRRLAGTRARRRLIAVTLLLGPVIAAAVTAVVRPADLTFAVLAEPVQILMSVTVPFLGALLAGDLRRKPRTARFAPALLAAALFAAAVGVFGNLVCAVALVAAPSGAAPDAWRYAGAVAAGAVLVQVVAQLIGTALGVLVRRPVLACLGTIVLPLGLWALLGAVGPLRPAQAWLAPFASAHNLLSGPMSALMWAQWLVVLTVWAVSLNAAGAARLTGHGPMGGPARAVLPGVGPA
ncbi:hypothetical protein GCM10027187_21990 [Streptosporangium sandarakinum]|uniref:Uncharacterized protein n=1 Tax=Streptosporangium sandarakinum TaxID=1260955 RepID=A0A852V0E3_9ACTN|nr:hypothetical protein [Streptosporangium sandarakinum]NYF41630.1 hypothetical protein [Streptosporangium sandarakinum]